MSEIALIAAPYAFWGIMLHSIVDWMFQSHIQANEKHSLKNISAWIHAFEHLVVLTFVFPFWIASIVAIVHMLIDTRVPLKWWRKTMKQTTEGEMAVHVAIWGDQVAHWIIICLAALVYVVIRG